MDALGGALLFSASFGIPVLVGVWAKRGQKKQKEKEDQEFIALVKRTREELGPAGAEGLTDEVLLAELRRRKKAKDAKTKPRDLFNDLTEPWTLNPVFRELRFGRPDQGSWVNDRYRDGSR